MTAATATATALIADDEPLLRERLRSHLARLWPELTIVAKPIPAIRDPREFIFDTVRAGTQLVPPILASDLLAIGDRDEYDDAYYSAFFTSNRAVLERRVGESIAGVAAAITGAWEAAGKPPVPLDPPSPPQRRRR